MITVLSDDFPEENSNRFRCCFGCTHVTTGSVSVCAVQIVFCILLIAGTLTSAGLDDWKFDTADLVIFIATLALSVFQIIFSSLTIYGAIRINHYAIVPNIIFGVIIILVFIACIVLSVLGIVYYEHIASELSHVFHLKDCDTNCDTYVRIAFGALGVCFVIAFLLTVWFLVVFLRCYQFVKAKSSWTKHRNPAVQKIQYNQKKVQYFIPRIDLDKYRSSKFEVKNYQ